MERNGAPARRRRGDRGGHPDASARVGSVGACGRLHRSTGRVQGVQEALSRRRNGGRALRKEAEQGTGRLQGLRARRAPAVQPHVQDLHGPRGGGRGHRLPASRDGAGLLRQLPQRADHRAPEGALRRGPDRQGVPERDHARELHLPHARIRAGRDAVLRHSGDRRGVVRALARCPHGVSHRNAGHPRRSPPLQRARPGRAGALREARGGHPVRVSHRMEGAGGHPQPHRLRPGPAPAVLGQEDALRGARRRGPLHPLRRRDRRGGRPHAADGARRCVLRAGRGPCPAHRARHPPAPGAGEGGDLSAGAPRTACPRSRPGCTTPSRRRPSPASTTRPDPSDAATAARTRRAPPGASPWTAAPTRTGRSPCATATPWSRCA